MSHDHHGRNRDADSHLLPANLRLSEPTLRRVDALLERLPVRLGRATILRELLLRGLEYVEAHGLEQRPAAPTRRGGR